MSSLGRQFSMWRPTTLPHPAPITPCCLSLFYSLPKASLCLVQVACGFLVPALASAHLLVVKLLCRLHDGGVNLYLVEYQHFPSIRLAGRSVYVCIALLTLCAVSPHTCTPLQTAHRRQPLWSFLPSLSHSLFILHMQMAVHAFF